MNNRIAKIPNNVQDRNGEAWEKLCQYVDRVAEEGLEKFSLYDALGPELFSQIFTLPESIAKLTQVKHLYLYGSKLKRIPPEIGKMESLEIFTPYTSYDLHWFPFEITNCKNLKDSTVSTRALLGNTTNRKGFPKLDHNPVRYHGNQLSCSICGKEITYAETKQMWITIRVATDYLPLLTNLCSSSCENKLDTFPKPKPFYWQYAHQGGSNLDMPEMSLDEYIWMKRE